MTQINNDMNKRNSTAKKRKRNNLLKLEKKEKNYLFLRQKVLKKNK